jgi:hypothetical protein
LLDGTTAFGSNGANPMQTLGISGSTPPSESRLKSLFWPSVKTGSDVDYLGTQGYWVCAIVAVVAFVFSSLTNHPIAGFLVLVYYYLGGVGVREHSRYAATMVFVMFVAGTLAAPGIVGVFLSAVLLSNLRATWIAASWKPESTEAAMPMRFGETWGDKFADKLPQWLWPKVRIPYYVFSAGLLAVSLLGFAKMTIYRHS